MHKVFISYHHQNDQVFKNVLIETCRLFGVFLDKSVDTGAISENLSDQAIRQRIRDEYLRDSTVTILLVGTETQWRKHVDWEIYSSMFDGAKNKKSGVLVITLPSTQCTYFHAAHGDEEKRLIYPENQSWVTIGNRAEYEKSISVFAQSDNRQLGCTEGIYFGRAVGKGFRQKSLSS